MYLKLYIYKIIKIQKSPGQSKIQDLLDANKYLPVSHELQLSTNGASQVLQVEWHGLHILSNSSPSNV